MNNKLVVGLCVVLVGCTAYYLVNKKECAESTETPQVASGEVVQVAQAPTEAPQVVALESGLKYKVLKESDSQTVAHKGNTITVDYEGFLAEFDETGNVREGKKFDSSRERGQKFSCALGAGQVIPGWEEGLEGMKVGEVRQLIVPSKLAYGENGAGAVIPANATLVFDVELYDVA